MEFPFERRDFLFSKFKELAYVQSLYSVLNYFSMGKIISVILAVFNVEDTQDYFHHKCLHLTMEQVIPHSMSDTVPRNCVCILVAS